MDSRIDFLNWLEIDMSMKILTSLEDPADLARISCVSRTWRQFVVENALWKQLCLRRFPQLSKVAHVVEVNDCEANEPSAGSSNSKECETLERDHRAYAILGRRCKEFAVEDCISEAIGASSTDNYPEESIDNTLEPRDIVARRASYWSSKGQSDPSVPETLIYKLDSDFYVVTEINIKPFRAFFQLGFPIYSAKYVRFRMGYPKSPSDLVSDSMKESSHDDKFIWTYTSQKFKMARESILQKFKLPEPILCIGGFVQIEFLGRVQKQTMDCLFYICVSHVEVLGQSLAPALAVEDLDPSGRFVLKNNLQAKGDCKPGLPKRKSRAITEQRARQLQGLINEFEDFDEDYAEYILALEDESDEEFVL
uniref:F-box protein At4g00755 n=1 Tax=Ziziphus jujuba TaxID=326968 RepID=A0A6P4APF9_ZIZJJ